MAINLNYFVLGEYGGVNPQNGKIDVGGVFDVITSPMFPLTIPNIIGLLSFDGVNRDTLFEIRINDPEDEILAKVELGIQGQMPGLAAKQIIHLENIPIIKRGKYTADILEKHGAGYSFIKTVDFFTAMYPPKRVFSEDEIKYILENQDKLITTIKTDYAIPGTDIVKRYQLSIDDSIALEEGYEVFPADNKLEVEGQVYDLEGVRRNILWLFGQEKPTNQETTETEENLEA